MSQPTPRRIAAWVRRVVTRWVPAVSAVCLAALLLVQIDAVGTSLFDRLARGVGPDWLRIHAGRVSGSWLGGLRLADVEVDDLRSGHRIRADSMVLRWRPLRWRWGRIAIDSAAVRGLDVEWMRAATDGDVDSVGGSAEPGRWRAVFGALTVGRSRVRVTSPEGRFELSQVAARIDSLRIGSPDLSAASWAVEAEFAPHDEASGWGSVQARGAYGSGGLRIDTLEVASPRSRLSGSASLPLDRSVTRPGAVRWTLQAEPLALADLRGLVDLPAVVEGDSLVLDSRLEASGDSARLVLDGRTSAGASARVDLLWGRADREWGGRATVGVDGLDPRRYGLGSAVTGPLAGSFEGRVGLRVEAGRAAALEGEGALSVQGPELRAEARVRAVRRPGSDGRGRDTLRAAIDTLVWRRAALGASALEVRGDGEDYRWAVDVRSGPQGRLSGAGNWRGSAADAGPLYGGSVRFDALGPPSARLSGTAEVEGRGMDPATAVGEITLALAESRLGEWPLDSAAVRMDWNEGGGGIDGRASSARGRVEGAGRWVADAAGGTVVLERVDVRDLRVLPPSDAPAVSALDGTASGTASWRGPLRRMGDPRAWTAGLDIELGAMRVGGSPLDRVVAEVTYRAGEVDGDVRLLLPGEGRVTAAVEGTVLSPLELAVTSGRFDALDLARLNTELPATRVAGRWTGGVARESGDAPAVWTLEANLDRGRVLGRPVDGLDARIRGVGGDVAGTFSAALAGGEVRGRLTTLPEVAARSWSVEMEGALPRLGGFVGRPDESVAVEGRARVWGRTDRPGAGLEMDVHRAVGWGVQVDTAVAVGELGGGVLRLDTLLVRSDLLHADGSGVVPGAGGAAVGEAGVEVGDAGAFRLIAELRPDPAVVRLAEGRDLVLSDGSLEVRQDCGGDGCRLAGRADLGPFLIGRQSVARAGLDVAGTTSLRGEPTALDLGGRLEVEDVRTPHTRVRAVAADLRFADRRLHVDAAAQVDDEREAGLRMVVIPGESERRIVLEDGAFRLREHSWTLARPALLRFLRPGVVVDTVAFRADEKDLLAWGSWTPDERDFEIRVDSFPVAAVADLLGSPGLEGHLDASVSARGFGADLALDGEASGRLIRHGRALHDLRARARGASGVIDIDIVLADSLSRPRLEARGGVPTTPDGVGWDLRLTADAFPLAWLGPYLPAEAVDELAGEVRTDLRVTGSRESPTVQGSVRVAGGRASLPGLGTEWTDVGLVAEARGREIVVDSVFVRSGGEATGSARIGFSSWSDPLSLDADLGARSFLAVDRPEVEARIDAALRVAGDSRTPRIDGEIEVLEAEVRLAEGMAGADLAEVELTDEDWAVLQRRFGVVPPDERDLSALLPEDARLDVAVTLDRNIWLRQEVNPEMAVQFTGNVHVRKELGAEELDLRGQLESIPERSYVEQFGRRFQLEEGVVRLQGAPTEARLDLISAYRPPSRSDDASDVVVRMALSGRVGELDLSLSSDPSMENSDIVSYLATGRPASAAFGGDGAGSSVAGIGTDLLAGELTNAIERFAREDVGLDVVEIRSDGIRGATLVAGQYVTPKIFIGLAQPVSFRDGEGEQTPQAEAEWRALRWLLVNLQTGGAAFRFFLDGSIGY